ncbi:Fungal Zn(2)-Cys(6) binuclear cluster domain-containing protein [Penicillium ucsense]|uniref:Fungal Zn(2)-Cys(6) binuclear cluster domain-containing protein n=1 Tax=Penicillium ucsense TaxID=2839758 RepID=A0A8J8W107_9EURO|nr:Fungal Zn(2)-Cys(6) binuclear cluster domain-containing protein [Penicillium ucsense]KAF7732956.1 Fungal Zn(2)-Cys(6) binuclear cluster domain-containing protein [Penicillium ucsense]
MSKKRELGPLDQRKRVVRCESCAVRKIKCTGGTPCDACIRRGKACRRRTSEPPEAVFVFYEETKSQHASLPAQMSRNTASVFVDQFFAFLSCNQFVPCFNTLGGALLPLVEQSSLLSSIASAIGALHASRRGFSARYSQADSPEFQALQLYSRSIESLKGALAEAKVHGRDDVLWATFLSGIFELMIDSTGDGWANHMLHGTSRLIQAAGPERSISLPRQVFGQVFQIFEANRVLVYGGGTILNSESWTAIYQSESSGTDTWDALSAISSRMVQVYDFTARYGSLAFVSMMFPRCTLSSWTSRFYDHVRKFPVSDIVDPVLESFGLEAHLLQNDLLELRARLLGLETGDGGSLQPHLAQVYCLYMIITIFNAFDYYQCWHLSHTPHISLLELSTFVDQIIWRSSLVLNTPGGPGVLLLPPLRGAVTRARKDDQRSSILDLLDQIHKQGFEVANRVKEDIDILWASTAN